jgi:hypothetical protein
MTAGLWLCARAAASGTAMDAATATTHHPANATREFVFMNGFLDA